MIGADRGERVTLRRAAHDTGGVCFAPAREIVRAVVPHVGYWSAAVGVMNRCAETVYPFTPPSRGEPRSFTEFRDTVASGYEFGRMCGWDFPGWMHGLAWLQPRLYAPGRDP